MAGTSALESTKETGQGNASDIISVPAACEFLGIHRNTLYKLIRSGDIPAFKMTLGGWWKFRRSELEQWLEDKQSRSEL